MQYMKKVLWLIEHVKNGLQSFLVLLIFWPNDSLLWPPPWKILRRLKRWQWILCLPESQKTSLTSLISCCLAPQNWPSEQGLHKKEKNTSYDLLFSLLLGWLKCPFRFFYKIKDTFFIFINNFIDLDILSMSAISHYWLLVGRSQGCC